MIICRLRHYSSIEVKVRCYSNVLVAKMTTFGSLSEPKWTMPGWRIEQRYRGGVLVGNWSEDRLKVSQFRQSPVLCIEILVRPRKQFLKGTEMSSTSTCKETYRPYSPRQWLPDPYVRRNGTLRNQVLDNEPLPLSSCVPMHLLFVLLYCVGSRTAILLWSPWKQLLPQLHFHI